MDNPIVIALLVGACIGLYFGLRWGGTWAFFRLGQFELKQRKFRARNWRL